MPNNARNAFLSHSARQYLSNHNYDFLYYCYNYDSVKYQWKIENNLIPSLEAVGMSLDGNHFKEADYRPSLDVYVVKRLGLLAVCFLQSLRRRLISHFRGIFGYLPHVVGLDKGSYNSISNATLSRNSF